jgi:hypothetical protein
MVGWLVFYFENEAAWVAGDKAGSRACRSGLHDSQPIELVRWCTRLHERIAASPQKSIESTLEILRPIEKERPISYCSYFIANFGYCCGKLPNPGQTPGLDLLGY